MSELSKNKYFAVAFRAFAFLFAISGILAITGVFKGAFSPMALFAYTLQSNILVAVFFGILLIKTLLQIFGKGKEPASSKKPYGFFPRLSMLVAHAIFVTMLVYWFILAPYIDQKLSAFFAFDNATVHLFTPLLMLADYLIFTERGKLKKYDPLLCVIIPYAYTVQAMILGLMRAVNFNFMGVDSYFLYFFLDIYRYGAWVILMVAAITIFFLAIAFGWRLIDKKLGQKNGAGK